MIMASKGKGSPQPKGAAKTSAPRPIPQQPPTSDALHGGPPPRRPAPPVGVADDPHSSTPRPLITGSVDSVMGAPLTPPPRRPLPKSGTSTPGVAKGGDKHAE